MESTNAILIVSIASLLLSATASSILGLPRAFSTDLDSLSSVASSPAQSPASSPLSSPLLSSSTSPPAPASFDLLSSITGSLTSPLKDALSAVQPAVKNICDQTDFSLLCVNSLLPYLADGNLDPVSVLSKEITAAADAAESAVEALSKMVANASTTDNTKTVLQGCIESYGNAIDNLKEAGTATSVSDVGRTNAMLSAAITNFSTCEEGFDDEEPGSVSPTDVFLEPLQKLTSNCLAIVNSIQNVGV